MSTSYLSDSHLKIAKELGKMGVEVVLEKSFPPYQVDCYIPDFHIVVEVDGPQHHKKADEKRDSFLLDEYGLCTFRISIKDKVSNWRPQLFQFILDVYKTFPERYTKAVLKCPWL